MLQRKILRECHAVILNHFLFSFLTEMADISAFKNYKPGDPTCRLYIKNLAKHVEEKVNVFYISVVLA